MLKQGEALERSSYDAIIGDIRSNQIEAINTFRSFGYEELVRAPLYEKGIDEVIMVKRFERTPNGFFIPIKRIFTLN